MALLDTIDRRRFGKSLERKTLDERGLDFRRREGETSSSREIDLIGWRYGLHTGGEGKGAADEITILNGNITQCDDDTYRNAVVTTVRLCEAQLLLHLDRRFGRAGDAGKFQPMAVARRLDNVAFVFGR